MITRNYAALSQRVPAAECNVFRDSGRIRVDSTTLHDFTRRWYMNWKIKTIPIRSTIPGTGWLEPEPETRDGHLKQDTHRCEERHQKDVIQVLVIWELREAMMRMRHARREGGNGNDASGI
jgi:hypothetical protein